MQIDLHMGQLMPLPLTVSCSSKSKLVLPFWYRLTRVVLDKGQRAVKWVLLLLFVNTELLMCSSHLPPIGFSVSTGVSSITSPSYTSFVSFILKPTTCANGYSTATYYATTTTSNTKFLLNLSCIFGLSPEKISQRMENQQVFEIAHWQNNVYKN